MKTLLASILMLSLTMPLAAKTPRGERTGHVVFRGGETVNPLKDALASGSYYIVGKYVCLPGDEHNAPDCSDDWRTVNIGGYFDITLEDGRSFSVPNPPIGSDSVLYELVLRMSMPRYGADPYHPGIGPFTYRLGKVRNGMQEISFKCGGEWIPGKGSLPIARSAVLASKN